METEKKFRRFVLDRHTDASGVSGCGIVAEGVEFSNGRAVINWARDLTSTGIYEDIDTLIKVHGHKGMTEIIWVD